ncbi:LysM peptidoglycan-binding domain-containing protein [Sphingomonas solaris]|uniref:LysM peptidoglycan-binding domain-containing protein n=1 Tax=Alterirhizorhabdus solaris TaxID=2529389 RepID=A0A558QXB0_9SPHN|nr:LysM peptidoglycan-binding domain-containing protein [Sphingomonas solaris]TVV71702.1 LysM peptidoglycan-binding domain-containing protein [Sphingomonas solaris]
MTIPFHRAAPATLALGLLLAGCGAGGGDAPRPTSAGAAATTGWSGRGEVGEAIALLNKGDPVAARARLMGLLRQQPNDSVAASLVRQIDANPETLLGTESFAYVTRATDTMSSLAGRFLGNPMLFYALARYNGLAAPGTLSAGRTLRIPGREKREAARPEKPAVAVRAPAIVPRAPEARPVPSPAARANPAQAATLRAAGLEQMNRGAIDRAVALLTRASQADPGNALIRRDLTRAIRIQRTVHGRS